MRERGIGRAGGGQPDHVGGHIGIAVAVAADPGAGPQDRLGQQIRVGPAAAQRFPDLGVDLRDHLEERGRVIAQPDVDLVGDLQPRQPDQRGLPQRQDLAAQLGQDDVGVGVTFGTQPHQFGDPVLGSEHRAAAGFGRVCGDDRSDQRVGQRLGDGGRVQVGGVELVVRGGQAAVLRRITGGHVNRPAPLPVDVFGQVGQQCEVAERPDDGNRLVDVDALEHVGHLGPFDLRATHPK